MGKHAQQASVVVGFGRIRRMHYSVVFKGQISQAKIDANDWNDSKISRLDQANYREWSFNLDRRAYL